MEYKLVLLSKISEEETNPDNQLYYSDLLINLAAKDSLFDFLHQGFLHKGYALYYQGDYAKAIASYFKSINYAHLIGDSLSAAKLSISIADTYSEMENSDNAENYYAQEIKGLRKLNDSVSLAGALLNAGDEYLNNKDYRTALRYFKESSVIYRTNNHLTRTAYNLGNIGMVYTNTGQNDLAEKNDMASSELSLEIAEFVERTKNDMASSELSFDIRLGINTGPIMAGVVGTKKFAYDIWGDTVNVASRMETMSLPGKINISEYTYALVKDDFTCEYRG